MSETITDELNIPDFMRELGLHSISLKRNEKHGSQMKIIIKGYPIFCSIKNDWNVTFNGVEKKVADYNKKTKDKTLKIDRELEAALYSILFENQLKIINGGKKQDTIFEDSKSVINEDETIRTLSISDAIRVHSGNVIVSGLISTITTPYKLILKERFRCSNSDCNISFGRDDKVSLLEPPRKNVDCPNCGTKQPIKEHVWINVRDLRLQAEDTTNEDDQENLLTLIFDKDTLPARIGERVTIQGKLEVKEDSKHNKFYPVLLAQRVKYEDRKKLELSFEDIKAIKAFRVFPDYEKRLVSMLAPNIIGEYDHKLTVLLGAIGAPTTIDSETRRQLNRGRINILLIGPPGTAKTMLMDAGKELRITSKSIFGKNTTPGSYTAMILSDGDERVLHLGAAPMAALGFLCINEFDKLIEENRDGILEVMQEGRCSVNKFAKIKEIQAQTSILATSNPKEDNWFDTEGNSQITRAQLPFSLRILSRFDYVCVFRDPISLKGDHEYRKSKEPQLKRVIKINYIFIRKLIEYARRLNPIPNDEAKEILGRYWEQLRQKKDATYFVDKRTLDNIYRISKAFARMNLTEVVDENLAYKTIEHMNKMFQNFNLNTSHIKDPGVNALLKTVEFIKKNVTIANPCSIRDAVERTCLHNPEVDAYLEKKYDASNDRKYRDLYEAIRDDFPKIGKVNHNPLMVYWKSDE